MRSKVLIALHAVMGLGAMFGGSVAILNPAAPLGIPVVILRNSPFQDFLIPGIILFAVIGLGNIASAALFRWRSKAQGYVSSVFSWAVMIWIVVQCVMLNAIAFLHVLTFAIGLAQAALSAAILFENRQFPVNVVLDLLNKARGPRRGETNP